MMSRRKARLAWSLVLCLVTAALGLPSSVAQAKQSGDETGIKCGIAQNAVLAFGDILPNSGGTVTLTPTGPNSFSTETTGSVELFGAGRGIVSCTFKGHWNLTGLDTYHTTLTQVGGTATMVVDNLVCRSRSGKDCDDLGRNPSPATFDLGGTLHVGSGQAPGQYRGSVVLTAVAY